MGELSKKYFNAYRSIKPKRHNTALLSIKRTPLQMKYFNQFIEAGMATKDESVHMGLKRRFATLIIKRIAYSVSDEPIQYVK